MKLFKIFGRKSGNIARERLNTVLLSDRAGCSTKTFESIRNDMTRVLSKYAEIDADHADFKIIMKKNDTGQNTHPAMVACIPFYYTHTKEYHG